MYDELARSQRRSLLESFVVNMLIPSLLTSFVLQCRSIGEPAAEERIRVALLSGCPGFPMHPVPLPPDVFPRVIRMPRIVGAPGRVVLRGAVSIQGRVRRATIVTLRTTNPELVATATKALLGAVFRPAYLRGARIEAWVTVAFEFNLPDDLAGA